MYQAEKTKEDLNESPEAFELYSTSDIFGIDVDEAQEESDFLNYFDEEYEILDLWARFRLLKRINNPEDIYDGFEAKDDCNDSYLDEVSPEQVPYFLRVLGEEDDPEEPVNRLLETESKQTEERDESDDEELEEHEEEIEEELEERLAA